MPMLVGERARRSHEEVAGVGSTGVREQSEDGTGVVDNVVVAVKGRRGHADRDAMDSSRTALGLGRDLESFEVFENLTREYVRLC